MPLTKLQIAPGIDKQNTEYGAEGRWVDGDNIRFNVICSRSILFDPGTFWP